MTLVKTENERRKKSRLVVNSHTSVKLRTGRTIYSDDAMTLAKKAFACFLLRVDPNHLIVIREIFADCFTENKKDIHRIED